jgi:Domain of unknown function (DUF2382)
MACDNGNNPEESSYVRSNKDPDSRVLTEETIVLLEERFIVDITRRKVGEIVVRKEIESHVITVQIPVRREKLIVEQISPEYKRLAEVDLGQNGSQESIMEEVRENLANIDSGAEVVSVQNDSRHYSPESLGAHGEFYSLESAINALQKIYSLQAQSPKVIRIEVIANDQNHKEALEHLLNS